MVGADCIFCRMGKGEVPVEKVFDDGTVFGINDINPKAPTHILLIPYAHVTALADAGDTDKAAVGHCLGVAPTVAQGASIASPGYRLVVNQGLDSGQEVPHFHMHILGGRPLGSMG